MEVALTPQLLVVRLGGPHRVASWAISGGGLRCTRAVAWVEIRNAELPPSVDPRALLSKRLAARGLADAVGLLTSRSLERYEDVSRSLDEVSARCVATVGLSNALRAGDAPRAAQPVGTINLLCAVSIPLGDEALLEALALASEAKALAIREAGVPSIASGEPASGTGTDCIVVASPYAPDAVAPAAAYAGKHTALGHVIGASVHDAVARGASSWLRERGAR